MPTKKENKVVETILKRRSTRVPFDPNHLVDEGDLSQILEAARWAPTPHNMQNFEIVVVDNKRLLEAIGSIKSPVSDEFIRESFQQLSFSEKELATKKVGLLGTMFPRPLGILRPT